MEVNKSKLEIIIEFGIELYNEKIFVIPYTKSCHSAKPKNLYNTTWYITKVEDGRWKMKFVEDFVDDFKGVFICKKSFRGVSCICEYCSSTVTASRISPSLISATLLESIVNKSTHKFY